MFNSSLESVRLVITKRPFLWIVISYLTIRKFMKLITDLGVFVKQSSQHGRCVCVCGGRKHLPDIHTSLCPLKSHALSKRKAFLFTFFTLHTCKDHVFLCCITTAENLGSEMKVSWSTVRIWPSTRRTHDRDLQIHFVSSVGRVSTYLYSQYKIV